MCLGLPYLSGLASMTEFWLARCPFRVSKTFLMPYTGGHKTPA